MNEEAGYGIDLAVIHDQGFGDWARASAGPLLAFLTHLGIDSGQVVELGCGSGILAQALVEQGFAVTGFDTSPAMLELARRRVSQGAFVLAAAGEAQLPLCRAVFAVGEVFNYEPSAELIDVFRRVFDALEPGGAFVFDVAGPGRVPGGHTRNFKQGAGWTILFEAVENDSRLERRITTFVQEGQLYRRGEELHRLRLLKPLQVSSALLECGFQVRVSDRYGDEALAPGHAVFYAVKPR